MLFPRGSSQRIEGNSLPAGNLLVGFLESVPDTLRVHVYGCVGLAFGIHHGHAVELLAGVGFELLFVSL